MRLNQKLIDLAMKYYDTGMNMQLAVDKAIKNYGGQALDKR